MPVKISSSSVITLNDKNEVITITSEPSPAPVQEFSLFIEEAPVSQNVFVTPWAAREMIKAFFQDIWDDPNKQDDTVGVEFDKQTLQLILAQNGCESVRFCFCKHNNRKTLVAFGTRKDGRLIGERMFKEGFDREKSGKMAPLGGEEGHGITLTEFKELISEEGHGITPNYEKIADAFLLKSLR